MDTHEEAEANKEKEENRSHGFHPHVFSIVGFSVEFTQ